MTMKTTHPSLRRRALALVAALGLVPPPRAEATTTRPSDSRRAPATDAATDELAPPPTRAVTGEAVTIDWWHIQNNDPGMSDWQAMADAYMAEQSERQDQHHGDGERGVQGRPADQPAGR